MNVNPESCMLKHIILKKVYKQNKNFLLIVCGQTGTGKSYTALRLAEMLDRTFNITRLVFAIEDFMELLNSGKLKKGMVIVWDEAGVGIPAREWYSMSNKAINYVLQTFRRENLIVIFTTPTFGFIDSATRTLFHGYMETTNINRVKKQVKVKYMRIQNNPRYGKNYFKYLRRKDGTTIKKMNINLPTRKLVNAYEKKKLDFARKLYRDVEQDIKEVKEGKEGKITVDEICAEVRKKPKIFFRMWGKRKIIDAFTIMNTFEVGKYKAQRVKRKLETEMKL